MLGSFQLSLDWRGSENFDLRKTHNVYSTTLHRLHSENSQRVCLNVCQELVLMNSFFCPDFIWFKKYVLGAQGWSLVVKMDAFKCKSVADGWENGHLPFNLVQETAIDQYDQEALHWHINGQKSSSHCFQLLFRMHFLGVMAMGSLVLSHSAIGESDLCRPWDICHLPCISQIFVIKYNVHVMAFESDYKYLSWDEVRFLCISHKCLQWSKYL